jgi:hypothetical protein
VGDVFVGEGTGAGVMLSRSAAARERITRGPGCAAPDDPR